MDSLSKNRDFLFTHWGAFPRQFSSPNPLLSLGYLGAKTRWVRQSFSTCNFSVILKGRGELRSADGLSQPIQAPCVLTQRPGEFVNYGPAATETWEELYLIYEANCVPWLEQRGFLHKDRSLWPIRHPAGVLLEVENLRALTNLPNPEAVADRVDIVCERLILESLLSQAEKADPLIERLIWNFQQRPQEIPDFGQLARDHGMSASTLRRRWLRVLKIPPARYILNLRIQRARRLLVESSLQVGEIATRIGFEDRLYFSRCFKRATGLTPREYRRRYQQIARDPERR
jgi:AraC-like DNA-binding protein